jgi:hypothetical protein
MSDQDPNIIEGDRGPEVTNPIVEPEGKRGDRAEGEEEEVASPVLDPTPLPPQSGTPGAGTGPEPEEEEASEETPEGEEEATE